MKDCTAIKRDERTSSGALACGDTLRKKKKHVLTFAKCGWKEVWCGDVPPHLERDGKEGDKEADVQEEVGGHAG